jgi:hypothetical protein
MRELRWLCHNLQVTIYRRDTKWLDARLRPSWFLKRPFWTPIQYYKIWCIRRLARGEKYTYSQLGEKFDLGDYLVCAIVEYSDGLGIPTISRRLRNITPTMFDFEVEGIMQGKYFFN